MLRSLLALLAFALLAPSASATDASRSTEVLSKVYAVDRKYRSMEGPMSTQTVHLAKTPLPELLVTDGPALDDWLGAPASPAPPSVSVAPLPPIPDALPSSPVAPVPPFPVAAEVVLPTRAGR